jgi:tetratricopeptide (TPR) repeat protein
MVALKGNIRQTFNRFAMSAVLLSMFFGLSSGCRRRPPLPPEHVYTALPPQFNRAVKDLYAQINARPSDFENIRKMAHLYQANDLSAEAKICYDALAAHEPGLTAQDHYYLAALAQAEGDLERAQKDLRAVLAAEPNYLPARVSLAEILFKSGHEDQAEKGYQEILARAPNQIQASIGLARIALQRREDATAIALLEKLLAAHPEATSGAALLAQVLSRGGYPDRAKALETWSQQKHDPVPDDPWLKALFGDCYESQRLGLKFEEYFYSGQIDEALPLLNRVEELEPKGWLAPLLRGWSFARAHEDAKAVTEYRSSLERGGDPEKLVPLTVTSLLQLNRAQEAVSLATDYYAKSPESQTILFAYTEAVTRLGDDGKTKILLEKLLEKEPYLYSQNLSLAKILWTSGQREEAVIYLHRLARAYPHDLASRGLLAEYYLEKSDPVGAIGPLEQALAGTSVPADVSARLKELLVLAYRQWADAETAKNHLAHALALYDKAVLWAPKALEVYQGKAGVLVQLKRFHEAADVLGEMTALQPDNPTLFLSLGDVCFQNGEAPEAQRHWQHALKLTPVGDAELRKALDNRLAGKVSEDDFK